MPTILVALTGLLVVAVSAAAYAYQLNRERRQILGRADGRLASAGTSIILGDAPSEGLAGRLGEWLRRNAPESWGEAAQQRDKLVQAGYDGAVAPVVFNFVRLLSAVMIPLAMFMAAPRAKPALFLASMVLALAIGLLAPSAFLDRKVQGRQTRIRRGLPDTLDLLVVCVEAGVSLDAALLRVARDMEILHPDLSAELLLVNRKVNAGITREAALHALSARTGVEELEALVASMIQCERWGTSIAQVLRVFGETLRRKRKQEAERKAATLPVKMMLPIAAFIFPTLFIVILGPAMIKIFAMFAGR